MRVPVITLVVSPVILAHLKGEGLTPESAARRAVAAVACGSFNVHQPIHTHNTDVVIREISRLAVCHGLGEVCIVMPDGSMVSTKDSRRSATIMHIQQQHDKEVVAC